MALINQLREKMGRVLVITVGIAIMSFVLADLLGPNSTLLSGNDRDIGEISGEDISLEEFQNQLDQLSANFSFNFGRNPNEQELITLRNQAWELLIVKHAFQEQYEELGLEVTEDEVVDMVQGRNVSPEIRQAFANPQTGQFDRNLLVNYLKNIQNAPPQQQAAWYLFENDLKPGRLRIKYDNLLLKTNYVTSEEAKREYEKQNTVAEVRYLYIPYSSVSDSLVNINDNELENYLEEHPEEFKVEESRSLEYVSFPIIPTSDDTLYFKNEIQKIKKELKTVKDDSLFARITSDASNYYGTYNRSNLPISLADVADTLSEGDIIGPLTEGGSFKLFKISKTGEDTLYRAKARHILIKWEGTDRTKEEARAEAQRILNEIRQGADFAEMARNFGEDGSASRGGDLGWGTQGQSWVSEFEEPVFSKEEEGLINRIVESQFGFHIIEVTEVKNNDKFEIAIITREISPSDETREEAFRKAGLFQAAAGNLAEFRRLAKEDTLRIIPAAKVTPEMRRLPGLGEARQIVQWLYNDASRGAVSDVFELDEDFVVAAMTGKVDEGVPKLEDVKPQVTAKVKKEKKAEIIKERLRGMEGTLAELAINYGEGANVYTSSDLNLSTNFLPNVGLAPEAIGKAFSLEEGERSDPIATDNGVVLLLVENKTPALEIADFTTYKNQLKQNRDNSTSFNMAEAVKKWADITDKRYKFY